MQAQFFHEYAVYFALSFLVLYVLAQVLVSKHPRFQDFSAIQKSVTVKALALFGFILIYILFHVFGG